MSYYIVKAKDNTYLTPRRNNGRLYESRSGWSEEKDDAKVFNTKTAARNSGNACHEKKEFSVYLIELLVLGECK